MERVRRRVGDAKLERLVLAFLKAGVLSEEQFLRSDSGTPQGGILSPLLANIALSIIEEKYERHAWPRGTGTRLSRKGHPSEPRTDPLRKKHPRTRVREICKRYGWRKPRGRSIRWHDGDTWLVAQSSTKVLPFRLAWQKPPSFMATSTESPVRNERRTPGSVRGVRKPTRR